MSSGSGPAEKWFWSNHMRARERCRSKKAPRNVVDTTSRCAVEVMVPVSHFHECGLAWKCGGVFLLLRVIMTEQVQGTVQCGWSGEPDCFEEEKEKCWIMQICGGGIALREKRAFANWGRKATGKVSQRRMNHGNVLWTRWMHKFLRKHWLIMINDYLL